MKILKGCMKMFLSMLLLNLFLGACELNPVTEDFGQTPASTAPGSDKPASQQGTNPETQPSDSTLNKPLEYKYLIAAKLDPLNPAKDAQHPKYTIDKEPLRTYFDTEQHRQNLVLPMNSGPIPLRIIDRETGREREDVKWFLTDRQRDKTFTARESEINELIKIRDGELLTGSVNSGTTLDAAYGSIVGVYEEEGREYLYRLNYRVISEAQKREYEKLQKLKEVVAEITKDTENLSEYQKVQYVHDYLVENIVYDYAYRGRPSPYLSLVKGRAVCEGYARAFKYLMDEMGVVSEYEEGQSIAGYHAWDLVKIEDGWYYLDPTWGRYQAFTNVNATNLAEVEVFLKAEPYPMDLSEALTSLGYTIDEYLDWKNPNSSEYNIEKAIEVLEKILAAKANKNALEESFVRNYQYFLIDVATFQNTHRGATKWKDGRIMGTEHINKNPDQLRDMIQKENTTMEEAPMDVKLVGISNTKGRLTNLTGKNIEYFMHNSKKGWQTAVEGEEIDIDTFYGSYLLLREKIGSKYSKLRKITPFWQDLPQWIKVRGKTVSELSGTMEYRKSGKEWQNVTDTEMTLEKGSYEFRLKGGENLIPSQAFELSIN